jgi:hypothetical protein
MVELLRVALNCVILTDALEQPHTDNISLCPSKWIDSTLIAFELTIRLIGFCEKEVFSTPYAKLSITY